MVDHLANKFLQKKLDSISEYLPSGISANMITMIGFVIGLISVISISLKFYVMGLFLIIINRFFDGLDGAVARKNGRTSFGGYIDILCDFILNDSSFSSLICSNSLILISFSSLSSSFL